MTTDKDQGNYGAIFTMCKISSDLEQNLLKSI